MASKSSVGKMPKIKNLKKKRIFDLLHAVKEIIDSKTTVGLYKELTKEVDLA